MEDGAQVQSRSGLQQVYWKQAILASLAYRESEWGRSFLGRHRYIGALIFKPTVIYVDGHIIGENSYT